MRYDPKATMEEFDSLMNSIQKQVPKEYGAFIHEKNTLMQDGMLPGKHKWLILLVASTVVRCPVCIPRAVKHCLEAGWSAKEILEACMVGVLVGGSSAMTYVTLVEKTIQELSKKKK